MSRILRELTRQFCQHKNFNVGVCASPEWGMCVDCEQVLRVNDPRINRDPQWVRV